MAQVELQLEKVEEEALDLLVRAKLFASPDEAARAAILKYAMDIGVLNRSDIWDEIETTARIRVHSCEVADHALTLLDILHLVRMLRETVGFDQAIRAQR